MRRLFAPALILAALSLPLITLAQGQEGWAIIPNITDNGENLQTCAAGWGAVVIVVGGLLEFAIYIAIFIATIVIIYAGFLMLLTPTNPENLGKGKKMLTNAAIGLLIALAAWVVVDLIVTRIGAGNVSALTKVLGTGDICFKPPPPPERIAGSGGSDILTGGGGGNGSIGVAGALCAENNDACSVSALMAAGLTNAQATAMSCIAVTESSGNPNTPDSSSGACGTFQITNRPGNWSKAQYHRPPCSPQTSCNNKECNLQTAVIMFNETGYRPWTGKDPNTGVHWNPNAVACVAKHDPGH